MENKVNKIIIFTLDSLYSNLAINDLSQKLGDRIDTIVMSERYGEKHGTMLDQIKQNYSKSGFHFLNYLSFVFIYYKFFLHLFNLLTKRKNRTFKRIAKDHDIKLVSTDDINHKDIEDLIRRKEPDLILVMYFDQLINENIFNIPKFKTINIHPGSLPQYRGPFPSFWAKFYEESDMGITAHYVDSKFDTGDIIHKKNVNINKEKSIIGVDRILFNNIADFIIELLYLVEQNNLLRTSQNNMGSYYTFPDKNVMKEAKLKKIKLYTYKDFFKYFK